MNYEIRRETEFGCTIYSVYNTETNVYKEKNGEYKLYSTYQ